MAGIRKVIFSYLYLCGDKIRMKPVGGSYDRERPSGDKKGQDSCWGVGGLCLGGGELVTLHPFLCPSANTPSSAVITCPVHATHTHTHSCVRAHTLYWSLFLLL